ncbi:MAG TPA: hypothetical protein VEX43_11845 [Chthoniobacterales bacterium]|nr:hypothetical protein [Chthoniobacterales bacterium]
MKALPEFFKGVRIGRFLLVFVVCCFFLGLLLAGLQDLLEITSASRWYSLFTGVPLLGVILLIILLDGLMRNGHLRWLARDRKEKRKGVISK